MSEEEFKNKLGSKDSMLDYLCEKEEMHSVYAQRFAMLEQENRQLKKEIEKLYTIRIDYDYHIENIHILDDYKISQLIHNKYLIELNDGSFVDIHEVVKKIKLYQHRLKVANEYIESRKEHMIPEHYENLRYIINECDLESSW